MGKVLLLLANHDVGLYKFRKELLEELLERGFKVYISLPNGPYVPKLKELGCHYIETPVNRRGRNPITDLNLLITYIQIIRKVKPNVVLTYTIKPNVYGGLACRLLNVPYLVNITGLGTAIENRGLLQKVTLLLYRLSLKRAFCVFFQNNTNRCFLIDKNVVKGRTRLIPGSGVNLKLHKFERYPDNDKNIKILFIGRIMKAKGIEELFKAAKVIKEKHPNVQFEIIGRSEEKYDMVIEELERQEIIKYYGQQEDVHSFIKDSHAIILPSHHEGLSNVLLESASTGRPVLASRIPGCQETFEEGVSGIGFDVKDVDSLINAIIKFIQLPREEKIEMGQSGRKKVEKDFDRNIVIESYLEEIDKVIYKEN